MAEKEAELSSLRAENERLKEEMESLRSQLDEARQNASLSAECGLKLMELNQDLEQRLEQTSSEYTEQIQVSGLPSCVHSSFPDYTEPQARAVHTPVTAEHD